MRCSPLFFVTISANTSPTNYPLFNINILLLNNSPSVRIPPLPSKINSCHKTVIFSIFDTTFYIANLLQLINVMIEKQGKRLMDLVFPVIHSSLPRYYHGYILFFARVYLLYHVFIRGLHPFALTVSSTPHDLCWE